MTGTPASQTIAVAAPVRAAANADRVAAFSPAERWALQAFLRAL